MLTDLAALEETDGLKEKRLEGEREIESSS